MVSTRSASSTAVFARSVEICEASKGTDPCDEAPSAGGDNGRSSAFPRFSLGEESQGPAPGRDVASPTEPGWPSASVSSPR